MASMSYCRWQNIYDDLYDAVEAIYDGKPLSDDEKAAMRSCLGLFTELLQYNSENCDSADDD